MILLALTAVALTASCGRTAQQDPGADGGSRPAAATDRDRIGRIYHYVRSNLDGTEKEDVYVFRKAVDRIEVHKAREKCLNAALVTAKLDMEKKQAREIVGGRLRPNAKHEEFAFLVYDPATRELRARIELPGQEPKTQSVRVEHEPWHLYDFDFASLTVMTPHLEAPRAGFSFGLPLALADPAREEFLLYLGEAEAEFRGEEERGGRAALRFALGGSAFGSFGGSLWLDAAEGHILDVETSFPNHLEYQDFKLVLEGVDDGGADAWRKLLVAHFEGCSG
jgi:hypothetical protein